MNEVLAVEKAGWRQVHDFNCESRQAQVERASADLEPWLKPDHVEGCAAVEVRFPNLERQNKTSCEGHCRLRNQAADATALPSCS